MKLKNIRYYIFLKDIFVLSLISFGGAQAHIGIFIKKLVFERNYLNEKDFMELYSLCQIIPGPTSTQTLTTIGFKIGGPPLAYLTLLIWILPSFLIMTFAAIFVNYFTEMGFSLNFFRFVQPIAVGIVTFSAYKVTTSVVDTKEGYFLMILSAFISYFLRTPYLFPILLFLGGFVTAFKYKKHPKDKNIKIKINWSNFLLWIGILIAAAILGGIFKSLPIRIFENFYRNGSLIFGGGQVLIPLLFTEFVEFKKYLSSEEFITGFGLVQALPGPVFSFTSYIGALIMREYGIMGQILGAFMATAGIFLPGTFLMYFVIRFWNDLKKIRVVKASLEGINAVSAGMVISAIFYLATPIPVNFLNYTLMFGTTLLLFFTKIKTPILIIFGLLLAVGIDLFNNFF